MMGMDVFRLISAYFYTINLLALALFGIDKRRAKRGGRRIPELWLLAVAVAGGSVGAIGGMLSFRHKKRKPRFSVGLPVILAIQVLFLLGVIWAVSL